MVGLDPLHQFAGGLQGLLLGLARELERDVDARDVALVRDEATGQEGLGQSDAPVLGQVLPSRRRGVEHQVLHQEVVFVGLGVLVVGQGVDSQHVGKLPRLRRQLLHRRQRLPGEDVAVLWSQRDQDVVVLGVDVL